MNGYQEVHREREAALCGVRPEVANRLELRSRLIAARTLAIALLSAANSVIRATSGKTSLNRRGTSGDQKPGHKIANAQRAAHVRFGTLCRLTSDIPEVREVPQAIITFVLACCAACRAVYSKSASSRYALGRQNSIATTMVPTHIICSHGIGHDRAARA